MTDIMSNPIIWLISLFCTVGGFLIALLSIKTKTKILSVYSKRTEIIRAGKSQIQGLEVKYENRIIENLYSSNITIWNSGNEIIKKEDIVKNCQLAVKTIANNGDILDAYIVGKTEKTNEFSIIYQDETKVVIDFDYVEPKDGFSLQVIHTGNCGLACDIKIMGGKMIRYRRVSRGNGEKGKIFSFIASIMLLLFLVISILATLLDAWDVCGFHQLYKDFLTYEINPTLNKILSIISAIILIPLFYFLINSWRTEFKKGVPEKIRKLTEDIE